MNASRSGCPINLTLEARSRAVVPHIDPEQRLCSFGSRRRPHLDAVPIVFASHPLAQAPRPHAGRDGAQARTVVG
jgi:hypothetical protein